MGDDADAAVPGGTSVPLASALTGAPAAFVRVDVALDSEPVIGSFTVDGMTFAVVEGGVAELVGVAPGEGSEALAIPESVAYEGIDYTVSSIAPYAFYLSGVASVSLPATVIDVDERAFRSSDVAWVEVDPASEAYASSDGALYSADLSSLLLIPGGRGGAVRVPDTATSVPASAFSHCAGVVTIAVDEGSPAFSSWEGLLYDADGATLLRVPAGATDITIRDGCTAIAAGALEGCAKLSTITAPASVASVSPDAFTSVPTVSLPAAALVEDAPQITALVALSSTADGLPEVDPGVITVLVPEGADGQAWEAVGFATEMTDQEDAPLAVAASDPIASSLGSASTYAANQSYMIVLDPGSDGGYHGSLTLKSSIPAQAVQTGLRSLGVVGTAYQHFSYSVTAGSIVLSVYNGGGGVVYQRTAEVVVDSGYFLAGWRVEGSDDLVQYSTSASSSGSWLDGNMWSMSEGGVATVYAVIKPYPSYAISALAGGYVQPTGTTIEAGYHGVLSTAYPSWKIELAASGYFLVTVYNGSGGVQYTASGNACARPGYSFVGWSTSSTGESPSKTAATYQGTQGGGYWVYAVFRPNTYTVSFNANGGSGGQTANVTATYDAAMPTIATTAPTRAGYIFMGWYDTSAATGGTQYYTASGASARTWDKTAATTLYARWKQRPISTVNLYMDEAMTELYRTVYVWYEVGWYDTPTPTDSTAQLATIGMPTRPGYAYYGFRGTTSTGAQGTWWKDVTVFPAVKSATLMGATEAKTTDLYAVWTPVVAADVPIEVTARVDLLGLEEQEEATGYIESRCGEPLTVADVAFEPLSGAAELFGAASVADVALEVLAAGSTSPDARFALDASASQAPASADAFRMAAYGTRVPISYRFAIPDELLPSLVETTKPVCSVAYTVALASA